MADPTGALPTAIGAGIGAIVVATIGVEPQTVMWAMVGAVVGVPATAQGGRARAVIVFVAAILACALLGTWASEYWHAGARTPRNSWSLGLALVFHPLLAVVVQAVPSIFQSFIRARTGGNAGPGGQP